MVVIVRVTETKWRKVQFFNVKVGSTDGNH